ncbi:MAG: outer membrane lipid asymmetry maintenance protein MlaD, partial [Candidatus Competibacterales bacterium]|nr:outer membrane lipid asymmetry maintenance protein MlaD [Candidatus Competibacterales bacterium]
SRTLELLVGLFIVLGLAALLMLALQVSGLQDAASNNGYEVSARFNNIGSLKVRAPVTMGGVRIGRVSGIELDPQTYQAVVRMNLDATYPLPEDTSASILTSGLLGEQYVGLEPGGAERNLEAGDEIKLTQSALVLERLIGQFLFQAGEGQNP